MTNKKIFLYYSTNLPKNGWMQACTVCDIITSKTKFYRIIKKNSKKKIEIYNYLCNTCKKKLSNKNFFENYCNDTDDLLRTRNYLIFQ